MCLTKRLTTIPQGSRVQANGTRNDNHPEVDVDIVCSAWKHAAELKARS